MTVVRVERSSRPDPPPRPPLHDTLGPCVTAWLEGHLGDRDLGPDRIAAAHHVSRRYLYAVLAADGVVLGDWVRGRRLERARSDLALPGRPPTVAAIAHRWGFADATHFSRVFRAAYGMSPREWRAAAR